MTINTQEAPLRSCLALLCRYMRGESVRLTEELLKPLYVDCIWPHLSMYLREWKRITQHQDDTAAKRDAEQELLLETCRLKTNDKTLACQALEIEFPKSFLLECYRKAMLCKLNKLKQLQERETPLEMTDENGAVEERHDLPHAGVDLDLTSVKFRVHEATHNSQLWIQMLSTRSNTRIPCPPAETITAENRLVPEDLAARKQTVLRTALEYVFWEGLPLKPSAATMENKSLDVGLWARLAGIPAERVYRHLDKLGFRSNDQLQTYKENRGDPTWWHEFRKDHDVSPEQSVEIALWLACAYAAWAPDPVDVSALSFLLP